MFLMLLCDPCVLLCDMGVNIHFVTWESIFKYCVTLVYYFVTWESTF